MKYGNAALVLSGALISPAKDASGVSEASPCVLRIMGHLPLVLFFLARLPLKRLHSLLYLHQREEGKTKGI